MAALAGKAGKVVVAAATVAEIDEWSYNPTAALLEKTKFLDNSKSFVTGLQDGSGSFKGRHDMTDTNGQLALRNAQLAGTEITLKLYVDATHFYSGPALIKGHPIKAGVASLVDIQFDFQSNGDWTYA